MRTAVETLNLPDHTIGSEALVTNSFVVPPFTTVPSTFENGLDQSELDRKCNRLQRPPLHFPASRITVVAAAQNYCDDEKD